MNLASYKITKDVCEWLVALAIGRLEDLSLDFDLVSFILLVAIL